VILPRGRGETQLRRTRHPEIQNKIRTVHFGLKAF